MSVVPTVARLDSASAPTADHLLTSTKQFSPRAIRDFALVRRLLDHHDERAYAELMSYYQKPVYQIVFKMVRQSDVAEDVTLEVFIRAFHFLHTFKPVFAFSTWLFRVATNQSITYLQRQRLRTVSLSAAQFDGEATSFDLPDPTPTPQEAIIQLQRIERMHLAVAQLPAKYQEVLKMHYFEELSYEEIATRLHAPLGTVKGQLHRGRDLLQHLLVGAREAI